MSSMDGSPLQSHSHAFGSSEGGLFWAMWKFNDGFRVFTGLGLGFGSKGTTQPHNFAKNLTRRACLLRIRLLPFPCSNFWAALWLCKLHICAVLVLSILRALSPVSLWGGLSIWKENPKTIQVHGGHVHVPRGWALELEHSQHLHASWYFSVVVLVGLLHFGPMELRAFVAVHFWLTASRRSLSSF